MLPLSSPDVVRDRLAIKVDNGVSGSDLQGHFSAFSMVGGPFRCERLVSSYSSIFQELQQLAPAVCIFLNMAAKF